jgi:23S rRNA (adenine-N6)-dimethyltransferase
VPASDPRGRPWGWHRLAEDWAATIVADASVRPGQLVLDIGAGDGVLTRHLVAAGAVVVAVELHPGRARRLRRRFADEPVTVLECDIASLRLPHRPFRVVANPPFAQTSVLLRTLLTRQTRLVAADLVLQRHVVRRVCESGRPGGGRWLQDFSARPGRELPRRAFQPPPRVDAAVLRLRRR